MASTLKNVSRGAVTIILDHPAFSKRASGWRRATAVFASQDENGARNVAEVRRTYPGTLTIQPGEEVTGLDDAIARCSQVAGLVASKVVSVTREKETSR